MFCCCTRRLPSKSSLVDASYIMSGNSKDCLECRLISGFGLIGISAYIFYQAKRRKRWENYTMKAVSGASFILGSARLLNISLFNSSKDLTK